MIKKDLRAKKIELSKDLVINSFFSEKKHYKSRPINSYFFILGVVLLAVIALEAGIITMMAAK